MHLCTNQPDAYIFTLFTLHVFGHERTMFVTDEVGQEAGHLSSIWANHDFVSITTFLFKFAASGASVLLVT